jgi:hypothetical protein
MNDMDINNLVSTLLAVEKSVSVMYIAMFTIAFLVVKKINSISISLLILCLGQGMASLVLAPLMRITTSSELPSLFIWYGSWMSINVICLALLVKFHRYHQFRVSNVAVVIGGAYVFLTAIQGIDFIERALFDSGGFAEMYQITIPAVNVGLIPVIAWLGLRELSLHLAHWRQFEEN